MNAARGEGGYRPRNQEFTFLANKTWQGTCQIKISDEGEADGGGIFNGMSQRFKTAGLWGVCGAAEGSRDPRTSAQAGD